MAVTSGVTTVGISAVALAATTASAKQIIVKAFDGNIGNIYIGNSSSVTINHDATGDPRR